MNKIFVSKDKIVSDSRDIRVNGNKIKLLKNDIYVLEYIDIIDVNICVEVSDDLDATLYECSFLDDINVNNKYIIDNAKLRVNKFYDNGNVNENIDIYLYNTGKIDYRFSNICKKNENYVININHNGIGTDSNIDNRSIALEGAKLNFVINSIVEKKYEKSILNQNTRIVTFGNAESKISPNMFIDCDDIEARHGSVIGTFKDDLVFYLMSRGIEYNDAIKLLVKGYLFANIGVISDLRERILNVIDKYWR